MQKHYSIEISPGFHLDIYPRDCTRILQLVAVPLGINNSFRGTQKFLQELFNCFCYSTGHSPKIRTEVRPRGYNRSTNSVRIPSISGIIAKAAPEVHQEVPRRVFFFQRFPPRSSSNVFIQGISLQKFVQEFIQNAPRLPREFQKWSSRVSPKAALKVPHRNWSKELH